MTIGVGIAASLGSVALVAQIPGRNVNMVSGTTLPDGDPYLQRQNEPSIAASTRNPLHLLGGANDYRTVDLPGLPDGQETGDAWLGIFKSTDGGQRWKSTLVPGYPQDQSPQGLASPLKGYQAGADPVVRAGTNGLFYYAGLVFDRGDTGRSAIFVARFVDNNNRESGDPVAYLGTNVVASDPGTRFLDKPWLAVDVPRSGANCSIPAPGGRTQQIPAGPAYLSWTTITGTGANVRSQIFISRSLDCGLTWSAPITLSRSQDPINQGSTIAIDPRTGAVIVAWRSFAAPAGSSNDSIMAARSLDFGRRFDQPFEAHRFPQKGKGPKLPPWVFEHRGKDKDRGNDDDDDDRMPQQKLKFNPARPVDALASFDQPSAGDRFRTNGYPTMTIDGTGRVYLAWAERGYSTVPGRTSEVDGDAKIVMVTSSNGVGWTTPRAVSEVAQPGHQFMPSLTFAGGKLMLIYYDLRDDISQSFAAFADDTSARPSGHRRTMDIRASLGTPGQSPAFAPSVKVSDYAMGSRLGSQSIEQMQFNPPNLPMFKLGTTPFVGDYIDLTPAPAFVADSRGNWSFNTQAATTLPVFQAVWTDNRDVRPPTYHNPDGSLDWTKYSPARSAFNPNGVCDPGSVGSRNQNIYTSRITGGLIVGSPGNNKPLNPTLQRGFVVFAQNTTAQIRTFRLTIAAQPAGGRASFSQFPAPPFTPASAPPLASIDVTTAPLSLAARTVYVTSTNPLAQVQIDVREVASVGGATVPGGLQSTAYLNPDITNPDIQNPDIQNPDIQNPDIQNAEVHNPDITNPDITNPDIQNPDIQNPDIQNPDIQNPDIQNPDIQNPDITNVVVMNPDITNPDIQNPDIQNPDIQNPDIQNPDIQNPDIQNGAMTDVTWTMQNNGNTTTAYNVNLFLANQNLPSGLKYQLILHKVYNTPVAINCDLKLQQRTVLVANIRNPDFVTPTSAGFVDQNDPRLTNPTMWLAPGEAGRITLRLVDAHPTGYVTVPGGAQVPPALVPALQTITPVVIPQPVGSPQVILGQTKPPAVTPSNSTILFLQQPSSVGVAQIMSPAVRVQVRDSAGGVVPGVTVTLSLGANPGGAVLSGGAGVATNATGIATFASLSLDKLGEGYTLLASVSAAGFTPGTSAAFNVEGIDIPATAGGLDNGHFSSLPSDGTVPVTTSVFVPAGQPVTISAIGTVNTGLLTSTPDGTDALTDPSFLAPALPRFALVGRIGVNQPWQFVGSGPISLTSPESGFLELAVNDSFYGDNTGKFTATATGPASSPFVVTNTANSGPGSLRAAIAAANAGAGPQGIAFHIVPTSPSYTIAVQSSLPAITNSTVIDATTQLGYAGAPVIALSGAAGPADMDGLVAAAPGITIRGLSIHSFRTTAFTGGRAIAIAGAAARVAGNYIGLDATGVAPARSYTGVDVTGLNARIGIGPGLTMRNVIAGNFQGVWMHGAAANATVSGNIIGADKSGTTQAVTPIDGQQANGYGVLVDSGTHLIGGAVPDQRNVIAGNALGVLLRGGSSTTISGNYIGTSWTSNAAVPNGTGISSYTAVTSASIHQNVISGNSGQAITLQAGTSSTTIDGNLIGVTQGGQPLGNGSTGIDIESGVNDSSMSANFIANNGGAGIAVSGGALRHRSFDNGFLSNGGLAIDLGADGPTANDAGDADTGPNGLQNYPVLSSAFSNGSTLAIAYSLDSLAGGNPYHLEFFSGSCDASGRGQGFKFGAVDVAVGSGTATIPVAQAPGVSVSATATDVNGNTSEFSACVLVSGTPPPPPAVIASAAPSPVAAGFGQLLTIRGTNLPGTGAGDVLFSQGGPEMAATYTWTAGPSLVIARLPGLSPGPATVRIKNAADTVTTAAYPVTISLTPGTPTLIKAMSVNCALPGGNSSPLSDVASGQAISIAGEGLDSTSTEFLFTHSVDGVIGPVSETCAFGNDLGGVAAGVTLPTMSVGTVTIQIRTSVNGVVSAWSNGLVLTVGGPALLGPAGGTGGAAYGPLSCSPGAYAIGFRVDSTNTYALTAAQLMCSDALDTVKFGGAPVPDLAVACAPGLRMVGFFGTDDGGINFGNPVVSSVGAECQAAGGGPITTVGPAPGGGVPFGPFTCPAGQVVVTAQGRSGAVVDSVQLVCGVVP